MNETMYKCPMCGKFLFSYAGDYLHPNDPKYGMYVVCPHASCPCAEVAGHGKTEKDAYEIVKEKFRKRD